MIEENIEQNATHEECTDEDCDRERETTEQQAEAVTQHLAAD